MKMVPSVRRPLILDSWNDLYTKLGISKKSGCLKKYCECHQDAWHRYMEPMNLSESTTKEVMRDQNGVSKGLGFVSFFTREDTSQATEETKNADVCGQGHTLDDAGEYAIAQVSYQAFKSRYGSGGIIVAGAMYFRGMSLATSNSRMAYAFSRDGAMPLSPVWHKANTHEVLINAARLSAFISLCMALPSLGSPVAFQAMVSIATIGLYIAYALPIFFQVTLACKYFVPGPSISDGMVRGQVHGVGHGGM